MDTDQTGSTTVESFIADQQGRRFFMLGAHLSDQEIVEQVNGLVRQAREHGVPTWFDREITSERAAGAFRRWVVVDQGGFVHFNDSVTHAQITEKTPGAILATIYEE